MSLIVCWGPERSICRPKLTSKKGYGKVKLSSFFSAHFNRRLGQKSENLSLSLPPRLSLTPSRCFSLDLKDTSLRRCTCLGKKSQDSFSLETIFLCFPKWAKKVPKYFCRQKEQGGGISSIVRTFVRILRDFLFSRRLRKGWKQSLDGWEPINLGKRGRGGK